MKIEELQLAAQQKQSVLVPAATFLYLLEKAYHVANTEPVVLGSDQRTRLSLLTVDALETACFTEIAARINSNEMVKIAFSNEGES